MTDIKQKAEELFDTVCALNKGVGEYHIAIDAIGMAIEQREAAEQELSDYKQKVSDAVVCYFSGLDLNTSLHRFVIPAPKPDPLVEVIEAARISPKVASTQEYAEAIRTGLNARGLQIVEKNDDR